MYILVTKCASLARASQSYRIFVIPRSSVRRAHIHSNTYSLRLWSFFYDYALHFRWLPVAASLNNADEHSTRTHANNMTNMTIRSPCATGMSKFVYTYIVYPHYPPRLVRAMCVQKYM